MSDHNTPFDNLPPLPPDTDLNDPEILRCCIETSRSLAELKGLVESIPEQRILLKLLPVQESRSSSGIESIVSSRNELFIALSSERSSDMMVREIMRYERTLLEHSRHIIDKKEILCICQDICGGEMDYRKNEDDDVYLVSSSTDMVTYTPPSGTNVERLMKNLIEYIYTDDDDPLIKMAVIHYQFESIHPFFDGNGRTGRIMNILYLQYNNLLNEPVLFLSKYMIEHRKEYYRLLNDVRERSAWKEWIMFMLTAVKQTSEETKMMIKTISKLHTEARKTCKNNKIPDQVADCLFENPFVSINSVERSAGCSRVTASKYLKILEEDGMLRSLKHGRNTYYLNKNLLDMFSD